MSTYMKPVQVSIEVAQARGVVYNDRGLIARHRRPGGGALVSVSAAGAEYLRGHRQPAPR
jgi:hypothetical protein